MRALLLIGNALPVLAMSSNEQSVKSPGYVEVPLRARPGHGVGPVVNHLHHAEEHPDQTDVAKEAQDSHASNDSSVVHGSLDSHDGDHVRHHPHFVKPRFGGGIRRQLYYSDNTPVPSHPPFEIRSLNDHEHEHNPVSDFKCSANSNSKGHDEL